MASVGRMKSLVDAAVTLILLVPIVAVDDSNERDMGAFWRSHHSHAKVARNSSERHIGSSEDGLITIFGRPTNRSIVKVFRPTNDIEETIGGTEPQSNSDNVQRHKSSDNSVSNLNRSRLRLSDDVPAKSKKLTRCSRDAMGTLDDRIEAFMDKYKIEGASLAYRLKDGTSVTKAFGLRRPNERMTVDTLMRLASLSKPVTAAGIMLLVQRGLLDVNELAFDILEHLLYYDQKQPDYRRLGLGDDSGNATAQNLWRKITVKHLLEHSAGWPSSAPSRDPIMMAFDLSAQDLIPWTVDNVPLADEPGSKFHYSNFGYLLLGRIIEARANLSYEDFLRDHVLRPCGVPATMHVSGRHAPDGFVESQYFASMESPFSVSAWSGIGTKMKRLSRTQVPIERADAALGWVGRPADFLQFLNCMDQSMDGMQLLNATSVRLSHQRSPVHRGFGMGWTLPEEPGDFAHFGALPGAAAYARHWHRAGANTVLVLNRRHEVPSLADDAYRQQLMDFHTRMATLLQPQLLDPLFDDAQQKVVFSPKKRRGGQELNASLNVADKHVREEEFRL